MREKIIAGNWKMNMEGDNALALVAEVQQNLPNLSHTKVIVHPSYTLIDRVAASLKNERNLHLGAQNVYAEDAGAFTGEVSGPMLKNCGVQYVIVGHSERRAYFNESNEFICRKAQYCLAHNMTPIICIGESLEVREAGGQFDYVINELNQTTQGFSAEQAGRVIIAYEPIWAIGTGKTATPEQAQAMHEKLRASLGDRFGELASQIPILYGGSMKPANARDLLSCQDIDGGLIGGASLKAADFVELVRIAESL